MTPIHEKAPPQGMGRINSIDLTKGTLILLILIYHSLNYSKGNTLGFQYLGFLPVSFVLISGFLISQVYSPTKNRRSRLVVRSIKLIAVFTVLNLGILVATNAHHANIQGALWDYIGHWKTIYILGLSRSASFQILLPIAYLLLIAPGLLLLDHQHRWILPILTMVALAGCTYLDLHQSQALNFPLVTAGLPGMLLGRLPVQRLTDLSRYWWVCISAYLCCFITGVLFGQIYPVQISEAITGVALIFAVCSKIQPGKWWSESISSLGRHSLVAYIFQIILLQGILLFTGRLGPVSVQFAAVLIGSAALMVLVVRGIGMARTRSARGEEIYRAIFA